MTLLSFFFDLGFGFAAIIAAALPTIVLPQHFIELIDWGLELIAPGAWFVDLRSFFMCSSILLSLYVVKLLFRTLNFLVLHIPFLNIGIRGR